MKRIFLIIVCLLAVTAYCCAQSICDPNDSVYEDILVWENLQLIENLSPLRPYPYQEIERILKVVMQSTMSVHAKRAEAHYERFFSKPLYAGLEYNNIAAFHQSEESLTEHNGQLLCVSNVKLTDSVSVSLDLGVMITNKFKADVLPRYVGTPFDAALDPATFGKFSGFLDMNMNGAWVTDSLYVQGGISRSSYGPFHKKSVVLGSDAFHTGNLSFFYSGSDVWNYHQSFFVLGATNNRGQGLSPEKFMSLHALQFTPFSWLSVSYYENMIYGGRFEPLYFLPVPYMVAQGLGNFTDNLQMGLSFVVRPIKGFRWASDFFVDDLSVNELVKLDFDTKIKIAAQTGVQYAFWDSIINQISADYTMIVPYMYTHEDYSPVNYQNYTTNGKPLGSALPPNSDRISVGTKLTPIKNLDFTFSGSYIRHANINESIPLENALRYLQHLPGSSSTDGSIFNYANDGAGYLTYAQENFMFMAQETKMHIFQSDISMDYAFLTKKAGSFFLSLGWVFEYIHNDGVQNAIFSQVIHNPTEDDVLNAKTLWKANLRDLVNNFISISVKYLY